MSLSSEQINYWVFRYLQESGFNHSSFLFSYESNLVKLDYNNMNATKGELIDLIQKGLLYNELMTQVNVFCFLFRTHPQQIPSITQ